MSRFPWRNTSEDIAEQSSSQWETPGGAQAKADKAQENAEKYSDEKLSQHVATGTHPAENIIESPARRFVSDTKIAAWDSKADGSLATQTTKGMMSPDDKAKLDKSTNNATASTIMMRDANGRAKVAAPSASDDIARKQEVDTVQNNLNLHTGNKDIHTSLEEKSKLAGIQAGAQVNQNAFAKINDLLAAAIQDGLTIKGGTGITITTNPITKELMITATGEATPGPHASSHITGGTDVIPDAVIDGNSGLMSGADAAFVRRDGETKTGAQSKADGAKQAAMEYTDEVVGQITPASIGAETPMGAQTKADEAQQAAEEYADSKDNLIKADYVRMPAWGGVTGGAAPDFTISLDPAPETIPDGFGVSFQAHADSDMPTLNINGLGASSVLDKPKGKPVKFETGKIYTVRKAGTDFLLDSGSAAGGAAVDGTIKIQARRTNNLKPNSMTVISRKYGDSYSTVMTMRSNINDMVMSLDGKFLYTTCYEDVVAKIRMFEIGDNGANYITSFNPFEGYQLNLQIATNVDGSLIAAVNTETAISVNNVEIYKRTFADGKYTFTKLILPSDNLANHQSIQSVGICQKTMDSFFVVVLTKAGNVYGYNVSLSAGYVTNATVDIQPSGSNPARLHCLNDIVAVIVNGAPTTYQCVGSSLKKRAYNNSFSFATSGLVDLAISPSKEFLIGSVPGLSRIISLPMDSLGNIIAGGVPEYYKVADNMRRVFINAEARSFISVYSDGTPKYFGIFRNSLIPAVGPGQGAAGGKIFLTTPDGKYSFLSGDSKDLLQMNNGYEAAKIERENEARYNSIGYAIDSTGGNGGTTSDFDMVLPAPYPSY